MCATTNDFNYLSTFPLTLKWIHWNGTTSEKPWTRATKHAHLHWCYSHGLNLKTHETAITSTHTNVCTYVTIKAVPLMYAQDVSTGSLLIKRQKMTKEINTYGSEKGWEKPVSLQLYVHSLWQVLQRAFATQKKVFFSFLKICSTAVKNDGPFLLPWSTSVWNVFVWIHRNERKNCHWQRNQSYTKLTFSGVCSTAWWSHDCLPLLLNHGRGFLSVAGLDLSRMLLFRNVKLLSWRRDGVLRDRAVLHVPGQVPVPIYRHWAQPCCQVEGQRSSGSDVGHAGVRHHRSIAVCVTATASLSFEVQCQRSPAPRLFDLSLYLRGGKSYLEFSYHNSFFFFFKSPLPHWISYLPIAKAVYDSNQEALKKKENIWSWFKVTF